MPGSRPARALRALLLALPLLAPAASAVAGEASVFRDEAVRLELVLGPPPAAGEPQRGAVLVDLSPGWTTYWRDPGEAGLAPTLRFTGSDGAPLAAEWRQPVPRRLAEGAVRVNAYEGATSFAVSFEPAPRPGDRIALDMLIGACREVCVPVSARLEARIEAAPPVAARRAVRAAFAALPAPAPPGAVAALAPAPGGDLVLSLGAEARPAREVFVAGPPGWRFGPPVPLAVPAAEGRARLTVPVTARPAGAAPDALPERVEVLLGGEGAGLLAANLPVPR